MAQQVTVAFSAPKRWKIVSWAIKTFTKSKVSHCLIGTHIHGIPMFLHCSKGGVHVVRRDNFLKKNRIRHEFDLLACDDEMMRNAWKAIDHSYDYDGILGFAFVIAASWLKKRVSNPFASAGSMWCSEFLLRLNVDSRIPEWNGLDPEYTHCEHLLERIEPGAGSFGPDLGQQSIDLAA